MITVPMASWGAKSWASTLSDVLEGKEEKHDFSHLILDGHHVQEAPKSRAILSVETDFSPVLLMALQGLVQPLQGWLTGLWTIEETAAAGFLHDLSAAVACELAESVRAVDNGKAPWALCVGQQEVAVCGKKRSRLGQGQEGSLASRWAVPPPSCGQRSQSQKVPRLPCDYWIPFGLF